MGRRTKFNAERATNFLNLVKLGIPRSATAAMVGWTFSGLKDYLKRGREALDAGNDADPYARFAADVTRAEAECKARCLRIILDAATGRPAVMDSNGNVVAIERLPEWQAAAWLLERRFPAQFAARPGRIVREADVPEEPVSVERLQEHVADARNRHLRVVNAAHPERNGDKAS